MRRNGSKRVDEAMMLSPSSRALFNRPLDSSAPAWGARRQAGVSIMAKITFRDASGREQSVDAQLGATVMEVAVKNGLPGIEAECGGACACATCHVYVDDAWLARTGKAQPMENDMLDFAFDVKPNSRLSCQIKVTAELDGLIVTTPAKQG
jgi:ferredoxin, 2Fe-2S